MFDKLLNIFLGVVMLLSTMMLLASIALGEENPLADYTIYGKGLCGLSSDDGQRFAAPCIAMGKEDDDATYFGILADDGETLLLILKRAKSGETSVIWRRPEAQPAKEAT